MKCSLSRLQKTIDLLFQLEHDWIPMFAHPDILSNPLLDLLSAGVQQYSQKLSLKCLHTQRGSVKDNANNDILANKSNTFEISFGLDLHNDYLNLPKCSIISKISVQDVYVPIGSRIIPLFYQPDSWSDFKRFRNFKVYKQSKFIT